MAVDNAGKIVPDPGESRREMGRAEDALRAQLDKVTTTLGDLTQAMAGARGNVARIDELAAELGLNRSRVTDDATRVLDDAGAKLAAALDVKAAEKTGKASK